MDQGILNTALYVRQENDFVLHLIIRLLTSLGLNDHDQMQCNERDGDGAAVYSTRQGNVECFIRIRQPGDSGFIYKISLVFYGDVLAGNNRYTLMNMYGQNWKVSASFDTQGCQCDEFMHTLPVRFQSSGGIDRAIHEHDAIFVMIKMFECLKGKC